MKKIVILLIFLPFLVFSFPYRLVRLIGPEPKRKIPEPKRKIVDLIFETHIDITQPEPAASIRRPSVQKEEKLFGVAERRLADIFTVLNKKPQKIDLLWELDRKTINEGCLLEAGFLLGMGCKLAKQYAPWKHQNITFVPADNFRRIEHYLSQLRKLEKITYKESLQFPLSRVKKYLIKIQEDGLAYLEKIKRNVNYETFKKLIDLWREEIVVNIQVLEERLKQYKSNITIAEFIKKLRTDKKSQSFARLWDLTISTRLTDIEMLMKIIGSDKKHVILYAGGAHCQRVAKLLEKYFSYTKTIDIGITNEILRDFRKDNIEPILSTEGLLRIGLSSGHKEVQGLMNKRDFELFSKVFDLTQEERFIKILKLFEKTYVDLFNLQKNGRSLLHIAAHKGWNDAVKFILKQPDISLDMQDKAGETPLHKAIKNNHCYIVEQLLKKGASKHTRNKAGLNALDLAAKHDYESIAKLLLKYGSKINEQNPKTGNTALHLAAIANKQRLVFLLIERGAKVDIPNLKGKKTIYYAKDIIIETLLQQAMKKAKITKFK